MFTRRKANGILCRYCGASENTRGLYEDGTWAYTNSEGITIKYIEGFSDFKNGIPPQVKKEFVIESGFEERLKDFCKAGDAGVGNTWHHHQDGKTI